ncbi:MAG: SDR family oxidoreductase [Phycisphaeraceae bacterium]|nr:SDR family oxidoreductase [Phycisphaeraceae bacterium]MCW5753149.1 SDR family oxidoreductase [Phycisphaeraceae bacterium]
MNLDLSGKSALVCGASAGIGRACAVELASLGATVTVAARSADKLAALAAELPRPGGQNHAALVLDLSKPVEARQAVTTRVAEAGAYHILINNTGGPPSGPLLEATAAQFLAAFETLLLTAHHLVQVVSPGMKQAGYGRIINIASTSVKQPIQGLGLSNAVRAAVANWAKTLSQELGGFGITVNNVLPGYTDTERLQMLFEARSGKSGQSVEAIREEVVRSIPAARLGRAEDIAAAAGFLASPAAGYINGINLPVDGGRLGCL